MPFRRTGAFAYSILIPLLPCPGAPLNLIYTEAAQYDKSSGNRYPAGAVLMAVINGRQRPLAPGFAASASASVSFDGKRVLFSGKQSKTEPWQIWELTLAAGKPRRITSGNRDAVTPVYLPLGRLAYSVATPNGFQIEMMPLDGAVAPVRLTYSPGDHIINDVLLDGRILFEAPHPGSKARDIYTVYTDGSGVRTYRCDHGPDRRAARQLTTGDILFETAGRPAAFTSARTHQIPLTAPPGDYAGPVAELPGGELLISLQPSPGLPYALHRWKPGSPPRPELAVPGKNLVDPVIVAPRPVPKQHPSSLGDRQGANLLCLNVYSSPQKITPGSVASVRVWTLDEHGSPAALGTAPVEPDGSFYVQVPADRPVRFQLLSRTGSIVAAEKSWNWSRRGEQRVCVGCHAGPERSPANAVPQVLLRSTEPVKMAGPK